MADFAFAFYFLSPPDSAGLWAWLSAQLRKKKRELTCVSNSLYKYRGKKLYKRKRDEIFEKRVNELKVDQSCFFFRTSHWILLACCCSSNTNVKVTKHSQRNPNKERSWTCVLVQVFLIKNTRPISSVVVVELMLYAESWTSLSHRYDGDSFVCERRREPAIAKQLRVK